MLQVLELVLPGSPQRGCGDAEIHTADIFKTHTGAAPGGLQEHGKDQQSHIYLVTITPISHPLHHVGLGMLGESGVKLKLGK